MSKHNKILLVLLTILNLFWIIDVWNGGSFAFINFIEVTLFALIIRDIKVDYKEKKLDSKNTILLVAIGSCILSKIIYFII